MRLLHEQRGIAIVLAAGMLSLLAVLAVLIAGIARISGPAAERGTAALRASLAAGSGLEYAAARLTEIPYPRGTPTTGNRGDDWTCRDPAGTPFKDLRNGSYGHGDHWIDSDLATADGKDNDRDGAVDEASEQDGLDNDLDGRIDEGDETDGAKDPLEAAGTDRDGNGRFNCWSGRLRGNETSPLPFVLRIESPDGRIPINAGSLSDDNRDGWTVLSGFQAAGTPPDHRDPTIQCHRGLAHALNNLGAILGLSTRAGIAQAGDPANRGEPIPFSFLGEDLLRNRPAGGYRSWEEVAAILNSLPDTPPTSSPYPQADLDRIRPFLDIAVPVPLGEAGRCGGHEASAAPVWTPVTLASAPHEVLVSLWMHLEANWWYSPQNLLFEAGSFSRPSRRTGKDTGAPGPLPYTSTHPILYRDEAEQLAYLARSFRGALPSWRDFHASIVARAPRLFRIDWEDLAGLPATRWSVVQTKADLAFQAVTSDPLPWDPFDIPSGSAAWSGGGLDRDPGPGIQPFSGVGFESIAHVPYPPDAGATEYPPPSRYRPYRDPGVPLKPLGLTLSPPTRFEIASACVTNDGSLPIALSGQFQAGLERLELSSQEDFENLSGGRNLASRGIRVLEDVPIEERRDVRAGPARPLPHVLTLPHWNQRGISGPWNREDDDGDGLIDEYDETGGVGFSRTYGAVCLGTRSGDPPAAPLLWPFSEDFDGAIDTDPSPPHRDFWHEAGATAYEPGAPFPTVISRTESDPSRPNPAVVLTPTHPLLVSGDDIPFVYPRDPSDADWDVITLDTFSIEAWIGVPSWLSMRDPLENKIRLETRRALDPSGTEIGTEISLFVKWTGLSGPLPPVNRRWFLSGIPNRDAGNFHVVLTCAPKLGATGSDIHLYVNGSDVAAPLKTEDAVYLSGGQFLSIWGADEVRLHCRSLSAEEAQAGYERERFFRTGTFLSPIYAFDRPVRPAQAAWTGILPDLLVALDPLVVSVEGFSTMPGEPGHPALAWSRTLGASGNLNDLRDLPPARSFRYRVGFDCSSAAGVLADTPVFESIWLTFRRQGDRPRWTDRRILTPAE